MEFVLPSWSLYRVPICHTEGWALFAHTFLTDGPFLQKHILHDLPSFIIAKGLAMSRLGGGGGGGG